MRTRFLACILCGTLLWSPLALAGMTIAPDHPDIQYTGRWETSNPAQPWSYWIGSSLVAKFEGTSLTAIMQGGSTDYIRVIIDGNTSASVKRTVSPLLSTYTLAAGLTDTVHQVELIKETDGGDWVFHGFELDDGRSLTSPPARPAHRIAFYGDSNLAGYSLESEENESGEGLRGSYYGYAGIASRMLDAAYHNVSRSGATISSLHGVYDRFDFQSSTPVWDFNDFQADVVVVNLGANDVGRPQHRIVADYHALLDDLRWVYPAAHIMLFNAWGWDYDEPANYIHEVIAERADPNMSSAVFPWIFEQWHGCEYDHAGMAQVLANHLTAVMGWSQSPTDVMNGFGVNGDVANGSFEEAAPFGGYGWRYMNDPGVSRVHDTGSSFDGAYHLRLENGAAAHQPVPATAWQTFSLVAWMRGAEPGESVDVTLDFRDQEMWTAPLQTDTRTFVLTDAWQVYSLEAVAPGGTPNPVFHMRVTFKAAAGATVEVDNVTLMEVTDAGDPELSAAGIWLTAGPNPFNPRIRIELGLTESGPFQLTVHDLTGRRVATLASGRSTNGPLVVYWSGRDDSSRPVGSGVYFARLTAGTHRLIRKMVLLR